ncbi:MAG: hypothetical protein IAE78_15805 [Myxococcus sp.]|nr:hypothetical protein [Myxococcus sp.]
MKPDVLVVEPDLVAFALAEKRLHDGFHLVWAQSYEVARAALEARPFDAVLVRAEDEPGLAFISRVTVEHPGLALVAIAPWEVQGDRARACGAREWVSAPVNYPRLAALLDFLSIESRQAREAHGGGAARMVEAPA